MPPKIILVFGRAAFYDEVLILLMYLLQLT